MLLFFFYKFLRGKKCATRYSFCLSYQEEQQLITMAIGHVPEGDAGGHCPSSISCSADPEHLLWQDLRDGSFCAQKVDNAGQFTLG